MRTTMMRTEQIAVSYDAVNGWTVLELDGGVDIRTHCGVRQSVIVLLGEGHRHFFPGPVLRAIPGLDGPRRSRSDHQAHPGAREISADRVPLRPDGQDL